MKELRVNIIDRDAG